MASHRYIIIDNDAGVDDAWAIFLLLKAHPDAEILAMTCVNGNTSLQNVCQNNLRLLAELNRREIPVYKGASSPLIPPEKNFKYASDDLQYFHGKNGFGDVELPARNDVPQLQNESAIPAIYRLVKEHPGQVTIVCLGPLTNIALVLRTYSDFAENVKEIFIMGGNYTAMGNTTKCAEFNFHTDPEAAYIVLQELEGKSTILPWETCTGANMSLTWREDVGSNCGPVIKFLNLIEAPVLARLKTRYDSYISADQILGAILCRPEIVETVESLYALVELAGNHTRGQIVIDHLNCHEHNTKMIKKINVDKYLKLIHSLRHL